MNNWVTLPIKAVYEGLYDGPHATPEPSVVGPVFLGIKNVDESGQLDLSDVRHISTEEYPRWIKRVQPMEGDIVFSYEATLNRYALIPKGFHGCLGRRMALIRPNEAKISGKFLFYYFFCDEWRKVISMNTLYGSTVDRIPIAKFPDFPITIPSLPVQRKIAAVLSAYDDLIENNLRRIKILEEMAQNLYREWFVKFRFPGHEHTHFIDSPLGLIPEGWEVSSISDIAVVHRGRSYSGTELADEGGLPFINLKCMDRDGGFRASGIKRYTGLYKLSQTVRPGEMVMAITDMTQERRIVAHVGRVPRLDTAFGVVSMDLVRIESRGCIPESYLYSMLRWSEFADNVKQYANGANVLHLLPARIEEYRFICPPSTIAARFGEIIDSILSLSESLEQKNTSLRRTRALLLPKLISGEIDVSELDITVPEEVHS